MNAVRTGLHSCSEQFIIRNKPRTFCLHEPFHAWLEGVFSKKEQEEL